jgi:hypothetical protein
MKRGNHDFGDVLTDYIESVPGKKPDNTEQLLREKDEMINDLIRKIAEVAIG